MILLPRLLVWSATAACVILAPSNFAQQVQPCPLHPMTKTVQS